MCRLVALLADEPVLLADILTRPTTGLVRQSFASQERANPGPTGPQNSYEQGCLNGDGYGLGWYVPETCQPPEGRSREQVDSQKLSVTGAARHLAEEQRTSSWAPAVVTSSKPAWNDRNLQNLSEKVSSPLVFAHVRAAGPSFAVSDATCHPFSCGRLLFMHNGLLAGYQQLLPFLVEELCKHPTAFRVAVEHGLIDSAVAFAFLLIELGVGKADPSEITRMQFRPDQLLKAMVDMMRYLCGLVEKHRIMQESLLNFVLSDGICIIACRYAHPGALREVPGMVREGSPGGSGSESPTAGSPDLGEAECAPKVEETAQATLYLTTGTQWAVAPGDHSGRYRMWQADRRNRMAIISSEPLTSARDEWLPIPRDTFVVCARAFDGSGRNAVATVDVFLVPFESAGSPESLGWPEHSLPRDAWGLPSQAMPAIPHAASSSSLLNKGRDADEDVVGASESGAQSPRRDMWKEEAQSPRILRALDGDKDQNIEVMTTQYSGVGDAPVLCMATVPPFGVIVVGSTDGGLRFFSMSATAENEGVEIRHHTGPIFALLVCAPLDQSKSELEGEIDCPVSPGIADGGAQVPDTLLFSASPNELRIWDMTAVTRPGGGEGPWPGIYCILCLKFQPNPGKVCSLAGNRRELFLGFQSGKVICLRIMSHWNDLVSRPRDKDKMQRHNSGRPPSMRTVTFDMSKGKVSVPCQPVCGAGDEATNHARARNKLMYQTMLTTLQGVHYAGIHGMAYHQGRQILVTAGSEGLLVFWSTQRLDTIRGSSSIPSTPEDKQLDVVSDKQLHGRLMLVMRERSLPRPDSPRRSIAEGRAPAMHARYPGGLPIYSMIMDADSEELFVGDAGGRIQVWGLIDGVLGAGLKTSYGPRLQAAIMSLQLIPNPCSTAASKKQWLLSGDSDGRICVWDVKRSVLIQALGDLTIECTSTLCWIGGGQSGSPLRLAYGGTTGGLHIFGGDAKGVLHSMTLHKQTAEQEVDAAACRRMSHSDEFALLKSHLYKLVAIESSCERPDEKQRASAWLCSHFEQLIGASVRVCSDGTVLARCGWETDRPLFVFYSHYDVVPAGNNWSTSPYVMHGRDGYLIGRGTTDCKGPILAQIFAVRQLQQETRRRESKRRAPNLSRADSGNSLASIADVELEDDDKEFVLTGLDAAHGQGLSQSSEKQGLPFNLLFVVDSSEEIGSPGLFEAIKEAREHGWLGSAPAASDSAGSLPGGGSPVGLMVSNSTWIDDDHPCVCYGMRGLLDVKVTITTGGERNIHTANAGLFPEPFFDLSALLGSIVDTSGRIQVPGFNSKVRRLPEAERLNFEKVVEAVGEVRLQRKLQSSLGFTDANGKPHPAEDDDRPATTASLTAVHKDSKPSLVPSVAGGGFRQSGVETLKLCWSLPAISVLEINSGIFNACGRLIPKDVSAVLSARTVPEQEPVGLFEALKVHLEFEFAKRHSGNILKIEPLCAFRAWECSIDGPEASLLFRAARRGVQQAWELENEEDVLAIREGSTIPALTSLQAELGCEAIQLPLGQASDAPHLPDERISEKNLARGVQAIYHTLLNLANFLTDQENLKRVRRDTVRRLKASASGDNLCRLSREGSIDSGWSGPPPPMTFAGHRPSQQSKRGGTARHICRPGFCSTCQPLGFFS